MNWYVIIPCTLTGMLALSLLMLVALLTRQGRLARDQQWRISLLRDEVLRGLDQQW